MVQFWEIIFLGEHVGDNYVDWVRIVGGRERGIIN